MNIKAVLFVFVLGASAAYSMESAESRVADVDATVTRFKEALAQMKGFAKMIPAEYAEDVSNVDRDCAEIRDAIYSVLEVLDSLGLTLLEELVTLVNSVLPNEVDGESYSLVITAAHCRQGAARPFVIASLLEPLLTCKEQITYVIESKRCSGDAS